MIAQHLATKLVACWIAQKKSDMPDTAKSGGRRQTVPVDGLFLLNKPAGITSNQALQKVKRLLRAKKAGHTGSLDPAATGMLPLCFGEATKVCAYLLDADKTYRVVARLGEATDTGDGDGKIIATAATPEWAESDWQGVLDQFKGEIMQVPPMYSALKKDGKRLYELARKGEIVERDARPVRIHSIALLELHRDRLVLRVSCSKGTYIRTLVEDIAIAAGTVAYTANLHRETVGNFKAEQMLDMQSAEEWALHSPETLLQHLLPPDTALAGWPKVDLESTQVARFSGGQAVSTRQEHAIGRIRVYDQEGRFIGVGDCSEDGTLSPKRIFNVGTPATVQPVSG